jgi:hypothetical protein
MIYLFLKNCQLYLNNMGKERNVQRMLCILIAWWIQKPYLFYKSSYYVANIASIVLVRIRIIFSLSSVLIPMVASIHSFSLFFFNLI